MEEGLLRSILDDNLIEPSKFASDPSKFLKIECFHFNLPIHPKFNPFSNIEELRIIEQDVVDLEWLRDLPHLTTLIVFHTQLKDASGLKYSPLLKKLVLEKGKLTFFPDISNLKQIEYLSVSNNLLKEIPTFPKTDTLKTLDISACGLHQLSDTILNIPNLQKLLIGGNKFHDFSILDILSKLDKLVELNIYDPNYGINPICNLPNYNVISLSMLPQVSLLDTFKVSDKLKQEAIQKKADTKLYYIAKSASDMSDISTKYSELSQNASNQVIKITTDPSITNKRKDFSRIYEILNEAEFISNTISEFYRLSSMLAFESGGSINFTKVDNFELPITIKILSNAKLTNAWQITHLPLLSLLEESNSKLEKTDYYIKLNNLEDAVSMIQEWTSLKSFDKNETFCVDGSLSFCLYCKHSITGFVPEALLLFSIPYEEKLTEIENLIDTIETTKSDINEKSSETTLYSFKGNFELTESLVSVNLVDCNIQTMQIFDGLMNLQTILVPFNNIPTLTDMPLLPKLEVLDVSFNKITEVQQLVIQSAAVRSNIKEIYIYGNPICEPKSLRFLMNLYSNSEKVFKIHKKSLYIPPCCDESEFLTSINAHNSITVLDLRSLCISSLSALSQLPNLTTLFASGNGITKIDFQSKTLEYADFSENQISEYPRNEMFPKLQTLLLNGNQLNCFSPLPTISALFVGNNQINDMPNSDDFPQLEVLFILGNPVSKMFPDSRFIFGIQSLKMLNGNVISPSQRAKINRQFSGVLFAEDIPKLLQPKQTTLDLSGREMRDVNALRSDFLSSLDLSNNLIASIDWHYNSFPHLQQLLVHNNMLQSLLFLSAVPSLRVINLAGNKLSDAHIDVLCKMKLPHLISLSLASNTLKKAPFLAHFQSLESVDLSHNFISNVDKGTFECGSLKIINLSYNSLRKLDNVGTPSLLSLDVSHNRIPSVEEVGKLRVCQKILKFWFSDNPLSQRIAPRIRCLCLLQSLQEMDGKPVSESDLNQVRILLEQSGISTASSSSSLQQPSSGRGSNSSRMNQVVMQPGLPQLNHGQGGTKRKTRFPRQ